MKVFLSYNEPVTLLSMPVSWYGAYMVFHSNFARLYLCYLSNVPWYSVMVWYPVTVSIVFCSVIE